MLSFKELRELAGMTLPQMYKYFEIPPRTAQQWENGERKCPEYLLKLMIYKLEAELLIELDK